MPRSQAYSRYDDARFGARSPQRQRPGGRHHEGPDDVPYPGAYGRAHWEERDWDEDRYGYPEATSYPREMNRSNRGYGVEGRFAQFDERFDDGFDDWRQARSPRPDGHVQGQASAPRADTGYGYGGTRGASASRHDEPRSGAQRHGDYGPDYGRYGGSFGSRESLDLQQPRRSRWQDRAGPKGYKRSDERIRDEVCERLTRSEDVELGDVSVEVHDGELSLTGSVPDRQMKHRIEDICDDCYGVREIDNRLRISRGRVDDGPDRPSAIWNGEANADGSTSEAGAGTRPLRGGH